MNTKSHKSIALALVVALVTMAVGLSACGSGGTSTEGTVVKIGVGAPLTTGVVAFGKGISNATKLAAKQANESARAKELGITFEVIDGDDQGDPKQGVTVANTFASDPALVGVVGHVNSGVAIPASKVYNENHIVAIAPSATDPAYTAQGFNNTFRVCTIDPIQGEFGANAATNDLGFKTAYVVDDSTAYGEGVARYFAEQFEKNGGTVLGTEKTTASDSDFTTLSTKIATAKPDVVYYGGLYNAGGLLAKQLRAAGLPAPVFGADGFYDAEFIRLAGADVAEGDFSTAIGLPMDQLAEGAAFKAAYEAEYPGTAIAAYDAYGYDAANTIINAVLKAAEQVGAAQVTSRAGRDAIISAVATTDAQGVTGKIAFDEKGDTLNKAVTLYVVKGGQWVAWTK